MKTRVAVILLAFLSVFAFTSVDWERTFNEQNVVQDESFARSRSGGSYGGGSRSYGGSRSGGSKSWGGSSKKSSSSWGSSSKKKSSSSWGGSSKKSSGSTFSSKKKSTKSTSAFSKQGDSGRKKARASTSYKNYKYSKNLGKGNAVSTSSPRYTKARDTYRSRSTRSFNSRDDYYRYRDSYYTGIGWRSPAYVGMSSYSSFGAYDAMFLWMMLDNINDARYRDTMYHRYNDPGMQAWRAEANKLAADNAELQLKLANLDAQLEAMDGKPRDPNYVPQGVDPSIIVSSDIVEGEIPEKKSYTWVWVLLCLIVIVGGILWYKNQR